MDTPGSARGRRAAAGRAPIAASPRSASHTHSAGIQHIRHTFGGVYTIARPGRAIIALHILISLTLPGVASAIGSAIARPRWSVVTSLIHVAFRRQNLTRADTHINTCRHGTGHGFSTSVLVACKLHLSPPVVSVSLTADVRKPVAAVGATCEAPPRSQARIVSDRL